MAPSHGGWSLVQAFAEAGTAAYLTLLLALLAGLFGLVAAAVSGLGPKDVGPLLATLALVATALVLASGLVGESMGMRNLREAVAHVNPCDRDGILFQGSTEARQCVKLALLFGLVPGLLALLASAIATVRNAQLSPLVVAGGFLLLAGVGVDLLALRRPHEGRQLNGAARDVLCQVLLKDAVQPSCAVELARAGAADLPELRALPEFNSSALDRCLDAALGSMAPDRRSPEVLDALKQLKDSPLLSADQQKRVTSELDALAWPDVSDVQIDSLDDAQSAPPDAGGDYKPRDESTGSHPLSDLHVGPGKKPRALTVGVKDSLTFLEGSQSKEELRLVIKRNKGAILYCYEHALKRDPSLTGKVKVTFSIQPDGTVDAAKVDPGPAIKNDELLGCMVAAIKRMRFPPAPGGTRVTYPFVFRPE